MLPDELVLEAPERPREAFRCPQIAGEVGGPVLERGAKRAGGSEAIGLRDALDRNLGVGERPHRREQPAPHLKR